MTLLRKLLYILVGALFGGAKCVFCEQPSEPPICDACQDSLPWIDDKNQSKDVFAPLYYEKTARKALVAYKFKGRRFYCRLFGSLMAQAVRRSGRTFDVVSYVPCAPARKWERGYDQAALLAKVCAAELGLPCVKTLRKIANVPSQTSMADTRERMRNVRDVFEMHPNCNVDGKRVLLADDIFTTGATSSVCRRILQDEAGAANVTVVVAARKHGITIDN